MTTRDDNPYVRFGLDPEAPLAEITARLRELAEDADDEEERAALRAAWNELSRSPARRLALALEAGPTGAGAHAPRAAPPLPRAPEPTLAAVTAPAPLAPRVASASRPRPSLAPWIDAAERALAGPLTRGATLASRRTR
ncbi:MAG: hypothetical protein U0234_00190 [Sandaracinus sp.]